MLEEVKNRPYFLRMTVYQEKMHSEHEATLLAKLVNSLRNAIGMEDRPQQIVASLSMLQ